MNTNTLIKLSVAVFILSSTTSCIPVVAAGTAVMGTTIAQERSAGDRLDDNLTAVKIRDIYSQAEFGELFSRISVTVYEGRAMLVGSVKDKSYATKAAELAWQVKGVSEVINELVVKSIDVKSYSNDVVIANAVRANIVFKDNVHLINYKVDVNNGIVYLIGVANNRSEINNAIQTAAKVDGVKQVINHIVLKSDVRRKGAAK